MKVILEYNKETGALTDRGENIICNWVGLNYFPKELPTDPRVDAIMVLKKGGFNAEEISMLLQD